MVKKSPAPKSKSKAKLATPENKEIGADLKVKKTRVKTPAMIANPGGRPSEFETVKPKLIEYIREGNPYSTACGCAGVSYRTFLDWMQIGRIALENGEIDNKYAKFSREIEEAKSLAQKEVLSHWVKAIPHNWQAAKEYLARVNPDEWGSKEKVDVTSNGESVGKPIFLPLKGDE